MADDLGVGGGFVSVEKKNWLALIGEALALAAP